MGECVGRVRGGLVRIEEVKMVVERRDGSRLLSIIAICSCSITESLPEG